MDPRTKFRGEVDLQHGAGASGLLLPDVSGPGIAYLASNGNDSTAVVGDPFRPFATAQAAFNAEPQMIFGGIGNFGNISGLTGALFLCGVGSGLTVFGSITGIGGNVFGNGRDNVTVGDIIIQAANGSDGAVGVPSASEAGGNGTNGSNVDNVVVEGLNVNGDIVLAPGAGGTGGYAGDFAFAFGQTATPGNGGNGGAGATLTVINCNVSGFVVSENGTGGNGGAGGNCTDMTGPGGDGGNGGNAGPAIGIIVVRNSKVGDFYAAASVGGTAGAGGTGVTPGNAGTDGTMSSVGSISTYFTESEAYTSNGEGTYFRASLIATAWNA
jgi:hypothetical protein